MSKVKKVIQVVEAESEGDWLVSYSDMMTLIACFFILMIAFANFDPIGFNKKTEEFKKYFLKDKYKSSELNLTQLQEELVAHPEIHKMAKVSMKDNVLVVTFSGSALFEKGEYLLNDDSKLILDSMIEVIKSKNENFRILVEGHTDNSKNIEGSGIKTSWGLSSLRASSVIERFEYFGFNPQNLRPLGLGDSLPLLENEDRLGNPIVANQKMNRRVVIKILEPLAQTKFMTMGLGVYFRDAVENINDNPVEENVQE